MNNIIFKTLLLKGEAGNDIQAVEKTATSGLVDTYTITLTDGSTYTFNVTNGKSIVSIEKTSSVGYVDTYTITYNDGTTDTFEITLATITVDDALSDSSTNPVENRVVTDALNTKSNNSNLATVESGTTASQAYTVGDYLVYNGQLCKVISAIAQEDTLTVGTNIEVTTSGGELTRLNSDLTYRLLNRFILDNMASIEFTWHGEAGNQRLEIRANLDTNVSILLQASYNGTLSLYQTTDAGATWQNIWTK